MRIENGIVIGSGGKYEMRNPVGRFLLSRFDRAVFESVRETAADSVLEIGCGEGHVTDLILRTNASRVLATDISFTLIKENIAKFKDPRVSFRAVDLLSILPIERFEAVVCCEVIEHLDNPELGLDILRDLEAREYVLSVPREPIFRFLNMCRGAYLRDFGNSPGHLSHFSQSAFLRFVERRFIIRALRAPLPWTVVRCSPR